jgi:ketosteroid isomerase-like protein
MGDEQDVLETFAALYEAACERRDAAAAAELFVADDDVWFAGSDLPELARGPVEAQQLLEAITRSASTLHFEWESQQVRVEGNVAWVNAVGRVFVDGSRELPYRATAVLVRRGGAWRWHTHNGSEPH